MLSKVYPYQYVDSVFCIDYKKLYDMGYRGLIFDIDSTLVPHGKDSTDEVDNLFKKIYEIGFKTLLLSNNSDERIKRFNKNIKSLYISEANKPKIDNYLLAVDKLKLDKKEVLYIGDQLFTDIYGANKSGIDNILVKFIPQKNEKKIGKKRRVEQLILKTYSHRKKYNNRIGDIVMGEYKINKTKKKRLFCEINPTCYAISVKKEICKRHLKNISSHLKFSKTISKKKLPNVVTKHCSNIIKRGKGIDITLQKNKAVNIQLACEAINGIIIHPGEVFSFWKLVGKPSKKRGFKDGRVIIKNKLQPGLGGGLCNLGNTIHRMVLHSPLDVIEFHKHSDALAPDETKRVPFSTGTSISYNNLDYRFKNNTDQDIQILLWCYKGKLYGELRSENKFPWIYELVEENHHFQKVGEKYYRNSKIYREVLQRGSKNLLKKELILDNHSEVMFDYSLIPKDLIVQ